MKGFLFTLSIILSLACSGLVVVKHLPHSTNPAAVHGYDPIIDNMPIVEDHPLACMGSGAAPIEQRDPEVRRYLAPSLKIQVTRASGSGTIIYYNPDDGYAYVQSCGHLWPGNMTAEEGKTRKIECEVETWYKNEEKLSGTKKYKAEVLWYSNTRGQDSSLLRFKPDWVPSYFPIAPENFPTPPGTKLHSCGCDGGREVAHYEVEVVGEEPANNRPLRGLFRNRVADTPGSWMDLVTRNNSPRPGRSGGGLMSNDYYVGICWGTSDVSGNGIGLFTPLATVRYMNEKNGYGWLNDVGSSPARKIPIVDRNGPQNKYPADYIPLPGGR